MPADIITSATSASSASIRTARSGTRSRSAAHRATVPRWGRLSAPRLLPPKCPTSSHRSSTFISSAVTKTSDSSTRCAGSASNPSRNAFMPLLIRDRSIIEDRWTLLREATSLADVPSSVPVIVPFALWSAEHAALSARRDVVVWLEPNDDPDALAADIATLPLIAVDFPQFADGRGYSTARLLRDKHGFAGELRAIGDVLRDQLYYLQQCGFNAFSVRSDRNLEE